MSRSWAYDLLKLADGPLSEVSVYRTVDGAVKALKAAPEPAEPEQDHRPVVQEAAVEPVHPPVEAVQEEVQEAAVEPVHPPVEQAAVEPVHPLVEAGVGDVAVEAEEADAARERAELREQIVERWALRTEHEDGEEIERLHLLLDRADARDRDRVATITAGRKREQAKDRKLRDVCNAVLALPPSPEADDLLAKFYNVARKRPAA